MNTAYDFETLAKSMKNKVQLRDAAARKGALKRQIGESVVLVGEEPASLAWLPIEGETIQIRNTYRPCSNTIEYDPGRDFVVDYQRGTLRRTPGSSLPDFRTNILFGAVEFDHEKFPGYGNHKFFAFVDYRFKSKSAWPVQSSQAGFLKRTRSRLAAKEPLKIVAFGDSITAGTDISNSDLIFWNRWVDDLRLEYHSNNITVLNKATPGDTSVQGLNRLGASVINERPDLVLVGFGMNDHNVPGFGVPVSRFERNLTGMIGCIRDQTPAEVILFSAFPPNPLWRFGSKQMVEYAAATERVARETGCAYADVFANWQTLANRKKPEDLLANNINHPNDFGHWIYYSVLCQIEL